MSASQNTKKATPSDQDEISVGLVMPIASFDGCSTEHWSDVKQIITDAIQSSDKYKMSVNLVSDAEDIGIIHKRIIQNIYHSDIVVCDVSGKNPNVMFELGMRLAFDKPTVIIKDNATGFSFDTGIIEHLEYPRDLRFTKIVQFKEILLDKVAKTYEVHKQDPKNASFLNNFGTFKIANLPEKEILSTSEIMESFSDLQSEIRALRIKISEQVSPSQAPDSVSSIFNALRHEVYREMYDEKTNDSQSIANQMYNDKETRIALMKKYNISEVVLRKGLRYAVKSLAPNKQ